MNRVIVITGNIGSGKSTAARLIRDQGFEVWDTDQMVHDFYQEKEGIAAIKENFGNEYIRDGKVDRESLGKLVFSQDKLLEKLENIVHTVIMELLENELAQREDQIIFIELPQYFEMQEKWRQQLAADQVLLIVAEDPVRRRRLVARNGWSLDEVDKRMAAQKSQEGKKALANGVIDNSTSLAAFEEAIQEYLRGVK